MPEQLDDDEDEVTQVIFSLTVQSTRPIAALEVSRRLERRNGVPFPEDQFFYQFGHVSFEEADWSTRADRLEAAVSDALGRLEATEVDPEVLQDPDVFVRAFFTFGRGAETIGADLVERLARYHAHIWIDA
jgi:hypothetical protein